MTMTMDINLYYNYGEMSSSNAEGLDKVLLEAYKVSLIYSDDIPDFFTIRHNVYDILDDEDITYIYVPCLGGNYHIKEIDEDIMESILYTMKVNFITMHGECVNDSQMRLFEGWYT